MGQRIEAQSVRVRPQAIDFKGDISDERRIAYVNLRNRRIRSGGPEGPGACGLHKVVYGRLQRGEFRLDGGNLGGLGRKSVLLISELLQRERSDGDGAVDDLLKIARVGTTARKNSVTGAYS